MTMTDSCLKSTCREVDYHKNPTKLCRIIMYKQYQSAITRLNSYPEEASTWICATRQDSMSSISSSSSASMYSSTSTLSSDFLSRRLPLHIACLLIKPQIRTVEPLIKKLIEVYPVGLQCPDHVGKLPLHIACWKGASVKLVKIMLESYPNSIKAKDEYGRTALDYNNLGVSPDSEDIKQALLDFLAKEKLRDETIVGLNRRQNSRCVLPVRENEDITFHDHWSTLGLETDTAGEKQTNIDRKTSSDKKEENAALLPKRAHLKKSMSPRSVRFEDMTRSTSERHVSRTSPTVHNSDVEKMMKEMQARIEHLQRKNTILEQQLKEEKIEKEHYCKQLREEKIEKEHYRNQYQMVSEIIFSLGDSLKDKEHIKLQRQSMQSTAGLKKEMIHGEETRRSEELFSGKERSPSSTNRTDFGLKLLIKQHHREKYINHLVKDRDNQAYYRTPGIHNINTKYCERHLKGQIAGLTMVIASLSCVIKNFENSESLDRRYANIDHLKTANSRRS